MPAPPVLFVFVDGVGLGPSGPSNPLSYLDLPAFAALAGGQRWTAAAEPVRVERHTFVPLDATLGVEGLPQSGTGQAALFTGENAARAHGRHYGPHPPTTVRAAVEERSLFARLANALGPERLAFANPFPERFFRHVERRGRWTTTTLMARAAGVRLRREADVRLHRAVPADLTGETWARLFDPALAPISEAESAQRLAALAAEHTLVLLEYWLSDKAGHSRDPERAAAVLRSLDRLFAGLLDALPPGALLLVTSDHGNIEDLSTKSHTRHPVPLVAHGAGAEAFADATSLLDVTPALVEMLT